MSRHPLDLGDTVTRAYPRVTSARAAAIRIVAQTFPSATVRHVPVRGSLGYLNLTVTFRRHSWAASLEDAQAFTAALLETKP